MLVAAAVVVIPAPTTDPATEVEALVGVAAWSDVVVALMARSVHAAPLHVWRLPIHAASLHVGLEVLEFAGPKLNQVRYLLQLPRPHLHPHQCYNQLWHDDSDLRVSNAEA